MTFLCKEKCWKTFFLRFWWKCDNV
uniref:Uncharacterized protein n=1 Tax=Anguilla anguilla TaxID=7936 RepID=A0A0E9W8N6_ANGAN